MEKEAEKASGWNKFTMAIQNQHCVKHKTNY